MNTLMKEDEVSSKFPNAFRNLEAEKYWVRKNDSIGSCPGKSAWLIANDTVMIYHFNATPVNGPFLSETKKDYTKVQHLVSFADSISMQFNVQLQNTFIFNFIEEVVHDQKHMGPIFQAEWNSPGEYLVEIRIGEILALGKKGQEYYQYELEMVIQTAIDYFELGNQMRPETEKWLNSWNVYLRDQTFFDNHPELSNQKKNSNIHIYKMFEGEDDVWYLTFRNDSLISFEYTENYVVDGRGFSKVNAAYDSVRSSVDRFSREGSRIYDNLEGLNCEWTSQYDSISNLNRCERNCCTKTWTTWGGHVWMYVTEYGGGKCGTKRFVLKITYEIIE